MMYLNDYDIARCERNLDAATVPNRRHVLDVITRLIDWTNSHSDGWAYWLPPRRAAVPAMRLVYGGTNAEEDAIARLDATDDVTKRALRTIKGFTTRAINAGIMTADDRDEILGA